MTTAPLPMQPVRREESRLARLELRQAYTAAAIAVIWLAVLFTGIFAPDIVTTGVTDTARVPTVVPVAFFAFLATIPVAIAGFRSARG
jgi:hypothetical protein